MQRHRSLNYLNITRSVAVIFLVFCMPLTPGIATADVARGSLQDAQKYYRSLSTKIGFSTPDGIFLTTLDDVASYFGYSGITGADLQNISPVVLMDPGRLVAPCANPFGNCPDTLKNRDAFLASLGGATINPDDILATRFFAPKIVNINTPEQTRQLGWRKLVRLHARPGSDAQANHIASGIILFNFFSNPGATPFAPTDESINTQVILIPELSKIPNPGVRDSNTAALYWLDYDPLLAKGGKLAFSLPASFDANELSPDTSGVQPYFVPDGCIACHGNNQNRSMVNYLDTDHWYDRLDNDFPNLKAQGLPILFDAQTNDITTPEYKAAFDVIRRFNREADQQAVMAQPTHDEVHAKLLSDLNQYCFRCHGTIKFSVFNKQAVQERHPNIIERIQPGAPIGIRMPTDRPLPDDIRQFLIDHLP